MVLIPGLGAWIAREGKDRGSTTATWRGVGFEACLWVCINGASGGESALRARMEVVWVVAQDGAGKRTVNPRVAGSSPAAGALANVDGEPLGSPFAIWGVSSGLGLNRRVLAGEG